jgi:SAM-dependent methyltransferase
MVEVETLDRCPLCGSADLSDWRLTKDRGYGLSAQTFVYARCRSCALVFLRVRPTQATVGHLYSEDYEPYTRVAGDATYPPPERLDALGRGKGDWKGLVRAAYVNPAPGARLLDFGCGSPAFAQLAQGLGWAVTGVDFSEEVVAAVRAAGVDGLTVEELFATRPGATFSLIRMNHVLEHLYDPVETVEKLRGRLVPGGALHVAVPNPQGLTAALFRSHWLGLEPRHLMLFGPDRLRDLLRKAGYGHIEVRHEAAPRDGIRSLEFLAQSLRGSVARRATRAAAVRRAWTGVSHLAARAGRGGRLHALARP